MGIIRDELRDNPQRHYLRRIETGRLIPIVRGLLIMRAPACHYEDVDIGELVGVPWSFTDQCVHMIETFVDPEGGLPTVYADRHQLQQAHKPLSQCAGCDDGGG
jgi:hypothetical protein